MSMPIRRFFVASLLSLALTAATGAMANPLIVVDVKTGGVIEANEATVPWYPASLTKLMTTLVVLNAIKSGQVTPQTALTYSARAQAEPPSKMGFQVGQTVTIDDALKMLMVQSANDIAFLLAEGVSGSAEAFVVEMNRTARQIGMTNTNFVNPNGLPVKPGPDLQRTTARDMAVLAVTLLRTYPEYAQLFRIDAIEIGNRILRNHNGLLGRYPEADGMKTGYTCSAGFNVVASATRGQRQLVTVVLGAETPIRRSETAIDAFERGFQATSARTTLGALPNVTAAFTTDLREQMCGKAAVKARIARAKLSPDQHPWRDRLMAKTVVSPLQVYATAAPGEPKVAAQPSGVDEDAPAFAPTPGTAPAIAGQTVRPGSAKVRSLKASKSATAKSKGAKTAEKTGKTGRVKIDLKPSADASAANGAQPVPGSIYRSATPADGKSAF
ncbi:D-alanyl-D-alanine carboxypeptidase family protein [Hansschlegelia plantiphila]|nr:serine hydrolase [Hansschlegelia plantiphila]